MITFIVPTYANPNGLLTSLLSIRGNLSYLENHKESVECIVLFDCKDPSLRLGIDACESVELKPMPIRYFIYETPSLTSRVNHAAMYVATPFMCVINDDIILGKSNSPLSDRVTTPLEEYKDRIVALYFCSKDENDYDYRFPIVSKRVVELIGYLYHPICAVPVICERWINSIFDSLDRMSFLKGSELSINVDCPTNMYFDEAVKQEAESIYKHTASVRKGTVELLKQFLVKE